MQKKLLVHIDMDGILTDLLQKWLLAINKKYNKYLTVDDITDWDVGACTSKDISRKVYGLIQQPMFFYDLDPLPGSVASVEALKILGHDVNILTSPASDHCATEKLLWLKKHFPFINHKNVHITHRKDLLRGDVLVDDRSKNCEEYQKAHPEALVITFEYPYNTELKKHATIKVAGKWDDTTTAWSETVRLIQERANEQ